MECDVVGQTRGRDFLVSLVICVDAIVICMAGSDALALHQHVYQILSLVISVPSVPVPLQNI